MTLDSQVLVYGFYGSVFVAALLLIHGLADLHAARRRETAARLRRLGSEPAARPRGGGAGRLRRAGPGPGRIGDPWAKLGHRLARLLDRVGHGPAPRVPGAFQIGALFLAGLLTVGLIAVMALAPSLPWTLLGLGGPLGALAAVSLVAAYLRFRKERWRRRFARQLPDALDVMVRSLRAGHPVSSAIAMVRSDLSDPIAAEFGRAVDEMTYGLDLRQALGQMAARVGIEDLRFVVASVSLQHETGGNLAELLQGLADLMRARVRLARKVRAYTADARLSARFLAVMPLVFVGLVLLANPGVYSEAARDPLFWPVLLGAGLLQILGILIMGRMARFKV